MKKYIINLIVVIVVLVLLSGVIFTKFIPQYYLSVFPFIILFFVVTSVSIFAYQIKLAKKDIRKFTRSIMVVTFLKLILYSAVAIVYIAIDTKNAKIFVACFMFLYVVFTFFDVLSMLRITANNNKEG